ncbi:TPA: hypothetical protein ACKP8G_002760 [Serratia marcescens]|uniref:hypothetical protein n=1 Tax=Raoultella planticola TaxID=575 RepID=UPI0011BEC304|nr:hypothetical protein [Raoultella planticola]
MNVFGLNFLEKMESEQEVDVSNWAWKPENSEAQKIYGSGMSTKSRESTYAAEKDSREDSDRPNEGLAA